MTGRLVKIPTSLTPLAELKMLNGVDPDDLNSNDWKTWILEEEVIYSQGPGSPAIVVPVGFMTDFASIPRPFRNWQQGSVGPQRIGAYLHDWLYSSQSSLSRKHSDQIFRDAMDLAGARWFPRNAMYYALRVGGWFAWRSNQKKLKEQGLFWRHLRA
jgi:hypothetical protein